MFQIILLLLELISAFINPAAEKTPNPQHNILFGSCCFNLVEVADRMTCPKLAIEHDVEICGVGRVCPYILDEALDHHHDVLAHTKEHCKLC